MTAYLPSEEDLRFVELRARVKTADIIAIYGPRGSVGQRIPADDLTEVKVGTFNLSTSAVMLLPLAGDVYTLTELIEYVRDAAVVGAYDQCEKCGEWEIPHRAGATSVECGACGVGGRMGATR